MLVRPRDAVLVENPTYAVVLSFLESLDCTLADVSTDALGIVSDSFEHILSNWPDSNPSGRKDQPRPHCLYTVPTGGNLTGVSASFERKQAIYRICSKYEVLVVEDVPYYFLQFGERPEFLPICSWIPTDVSCALTA